MRRLAALGLLALPILAVSCREQFPQSALHPESEYGRALQGLLVNIFWWEVGIFAVVEGALLFALFRFRARPGQPEPAQTHGHTGIEVAWTLAPAVILAFIGVPTVHTIFQTQAPAPRNALQVEVVGHQWWWEFRYPDLGIVTASELHLPVGRTVNFKMTSADVVHSFWVPVLGGKRDVIPGRTNFIWLTPDSLGQFPGQCAELCGESHANMRLEAVVESPEQFESWAARQKTPPVTPTDSLAVQGKQAFVTGACVACHTITGVAAGQVGPNLDHVGSRHSLAGGMLPLNPENLKKWLSNPPAVKPGSTMPNLNLNEEQLRALVAYLETLK